MFDDIVSVFVFVGVSPNRLTVKEKGNKSNCRIIVLAVDAPTFGIMGIFN